MRVTIVGAGGYLGAGFRAAAEAAGLDVTPTSSRDGTGVDPVTGLLGERFRIAPGTDAVVYLAQSPHYRNLPRHAAHLLMVNGVSAVETARRAAEAGVRRFLYASTGSVYAPSFAPLSESSPLVESSWYPLSKIFAEKALALFRPAMEVCALRIFGIYGPAQSDKLVPNLLKRILAGEPVMLQANPTNPDDRDGLRISLCHVGDACAVLLRLLALDEPLPPVLNLGGEAVDLRSLAGMLARGVGHEARFVEAAEPRVGDLVCDGALLDALVGAVFRPLAVGLVDVLGALGSGR
jgi:UDP-glucose 4-epimerase